MKTIDTSFIWFSNHSFSPLLLNFNICSAQLFWRHLELSLPNKNHPQNHRKHNRNRDQNQANEDLAAVSPQRRAIFLTDLSKGFYNKGTVYQLSKEWTMLIQCVTQVGSHHNISVEWRSQSSCGNAEARWRSVAYETLICLVIIKYKSFSSYNKQSTLPQYLVYEVSEWESSVYWKF